MKNQIIFIKGKVYNQGTNYPFILCTETTCSITKKTWTGVVLRAGKESKNLVIGHISPNWIANDTWKEKKGY